MHPAKTLFADRVVYYRNGTDAKLAFVIQVNGDHNANLLFYCPQAKAWFEATSIDFGKQADGVCYFTNPEG